MRGNRSLRRWASGTTIVALVPFVVVQLVDWIARAFDCTLQISIATAPCGLDDVSVGVLTSLGVAGVLLSPFAMPLLIVAAILWALFAASVRLDPGPDML